MQLFLLSSALLLALIAPASRVVATPVLGNYPNTSMLLSRDTTVPPDAAPINTTRINVFTSTNFKGTLEGNPATGVVRVTDAHPAGTYTVTAKGFDSGGASATKTFTLTVTTPTTCDPITFAPAANYDPGTSPNSVAVGDFNGDGNQDLAVPNGSSNDVSILLGDGVGHFSAPTNFGAGTGPYSVAVGDFNGDGNQDLAVANSTSNNVSILSGDGAGHFSAPTNFGAASSPRSVAVADFNRDGKQDLAVANYSSGAVSILLGEGTGNFDSAINFDAGSNADSITVGDFNGDGKQDLAVANNFSNYMSILLGNGAGGFNGPNYFGTGNALHPTSVAVGDFNGDSNQDLAFAYQGGTVSVFLGNGSGNFSAGAPFGTLNYCVSVAVADFNGDGKQDLVVANYGEFYVSIFLGNGAGNFGDAINVETPYGPHGIAVGDFNGDGKQDLAVASNRFGSSVSILLRTCPATPTLTGAVSRKGAGFDIDLPLTGTPAIECRIGGATNDYTIVVNFSGNVTVNGNPQAQVTLGMGTVGSGGVSNGGMVTISGSAVTIPLTNITNAQTINVTLYGVSNGIGDVVIPMSVLPGDVTANGIVNSSDIVATKSRVAQPVNQATLRADVNANGVINATDVSIVKSYNHTALP